MIRTLRTTLLFAVPWIFVSGIASAAPATNMTAPPPAPTQPKSLGEKVYLMRCAVCHGLTGAADGPAIKDLKLTVPALKGMNQNDIEKLVTGTGKSSAKHGRYQELTSQEMQELINYVSTLTK